MRVLNHKPFISVLYIGVAAGKFVEILVKNKYMKGKKIGLKGRCRIKNVEEKTYLAHIAVYY